MARSAAEVQEEPKKKKPSEMIQQINQILDLAISRGKTFSVEDLKELETRGKAAREEHDVRQMTPTPTGRKSTVAKVVPTKEVEMTKPAIVAALKLAETFELAGSVRTLSIRGWIDAGRIA